LGQGVCRTAEMQKR